MGGSSAGPPSRVGPRCTNSRGSRDFSLLSGFLGPPGTFPFRPPGAAGDPERPTGGKVLTAGPRLMCFVIQTRRVFWQLPFISSPKKKTRALLGTCGELDAVHEGRVPHISGAAPRRWLPAPTWVGSALQAAALGTDSSRAWPQRRGRKTGLGGSWCRNRAGESAQRKLFPLLLSSPG